MLFTIVLTVLVTVLCLLFGVLLGAKMYDLFGWRFICAAGPLVAFAIGVGFGIRHIGLTAGIIAGAIGAVGSAVALFKD